MLDELPRNILTTRVILFVGSISLLLPIWNFATGQDPLSVSVVLMKTVAVLYVVLGLSFAFVAVRVLPGKVQIAELTAKYDTEIRQAKKLQNQATAEKAKADSKEAELRQGKEHLDLKEREIKRLEEALQQNRDRVAQEQKRLEIEKADLRSKRSSYEKQMVLLADRENDVYSELQRIATREAEVEQSLGTLTFDKERLESEIVEQGSTLSKLQAEVSDSNAKFTLLSEKIEAKASELSTVSDELKLFESARDTFQRDLLELQKAQLAVESDQSEVVAEKVALEQKRVQLKELETNLGELKRLTAERDLNADSKLEDAQQRFLAVQAEHNSLREFRARLWANCFQEQAVIPSTADIERDAQQKNIDACMLLAYVHLLGTIQESKSLSKEFNLLWPCVRGIGRFLVVYLESGGASPHEVAKCLGGWAHVLNEKSQGQFELWVPSVGETFKPSSMDSQSGAIDSVTRILNWAVSKSNSIMASKAEVY